MNISTACGFSLLLHLAVLLTLNTTPQLQRAATSPAPSIQSVRLHIEPAKPATPAPSQPEPVKKTQTALTQQQDTPKTIKPTAKSVAKKSQINQLKEQQTVSKPDTSPKKETRVTQRPPEEPQETVKSVVDKTVTPHQEATQSSSAQQQEFFYSTANTLQTQTASEMEEWKSKLYSLINQYKHYPYQAKRRKQEGYVQLKAVIAGDGQLIKAEVLSGNKLFYKSSLQALKRSMPLPPPGGTDINIRLNIRYQLL